MSIGRGARNREKGTKFGWGVDEQWKQVGEKPRKKPRRQQGVQREPSSLFSNHLRLFVLFTRVVPHMQCSDIKCLVVPQDRKQDKNPLLNLYWSNLYVWSSRDRNEHALEHAPTAGDDTKMPSEQFRTTRRSRGGAARGGGTPCATSRGTGSAACCWRRTFLQPQR